jgi:hypothetical protein
VVYNPQRPNTKRIEPPMICCAIDGVRLDMVLFVCIWLFCLF